MQGRAQRTDQTIWRWSVQAVAGMRARLEAGGCVADKKRYSPRCAGSEGKGNTGHGGNPDKCLKCMARRLKGVGGPPEGGWGPPEGGWGPPEGGWGPA